MKARALARSQEIVVVTSPYHSLTPVGHAARAGALRARPARSIGPKPKQARWWMGAAGIFKSPLTIPHNSLTASSHVRKMKRPENEASV